MPFSLSEKLARSFLLKEAKSSPDRKMTELITFDNLKAAITSFLNDARQPCTFYIPEQWFCQNFQLNLLYEDVKKLSNTNCIASRHIEGEKSLLPVDMRLSKTPLLQLPNDAGSSAPYLVSRKCSPRNHPCLKNK